MWFLVFAVGAFTVYISLKNEKLGSALMVGIAAVTLLWLAFGLTDGGENSRPADWPGVQTTQMPAPGVILPAATPIASPPATPSG